MKKRASKCTTTIRAYHHRAVSGCDDDVMGSEALFVLLILAAVAVKDRVSPRVYNIFSIIVALCILVLLTLLLLL